MSPRSGDVLRVTRSASVQFREPMMFRVIRVHDWQTPDGWAWLDGYQLDSSGDAVERRSIYVQLRGLQRAQPATAGRSSLASGSKDPAPAPRAGTPDRIQASR